MTKRPAIGTSPLDALLSSDAPPAAPPAPRREPTTAASSRTTTTATPRTPRRIRATFLVEPDLVERARNTVVALAGPPERLTLAGLATRALTREIERLERAHNGGEPFPRFGRPLSGGRPISAGIGDQAPRRRPRR